MRCAKHCLAHLIFAHKVYRLFLLLRDQVYFTFFLYAATLVATLAFRLL